MSALSFFQSALQVRILLDALEPSGPGSWESKVLDAKRCGLVKAVCQEGDGSYEWVQSKWRDHYVRLGHNLLGLGRDELLALDKPIDLV